MMTILYLLNLLIVTTLGVSILTYLQSRQRRLKLRRIRVESNLQKALHRR